MRAAIYTRISLDKTGGRAGVSRQRTDCEALCARRGWAVAGYFEDNDRSAYSGRERPAYERLVAAVGSGEIEVVVAYHHDRLWRNVLEQQTFLVLGRRALLKLVATPNQDFDPADADDAFMSTLMAAVAQKESADKSRRMKRRQLEKAERGEFHGGTRAFGYRHVGPGQVELEPAEADEVREAVRRVLRGESMRSIVLDWIRRGVTTAGGKAWRVDSLSNYLQRPRIAGLRSHLGGPPVAAKWPAIIDRETHERLVALFDARRRGPRSRTPKYFLSGLVRCGRCGATMAIVPIRGRNVYRCPIPGNGGCGRTNVVQRHLEETARDIVLDYLDSPALAAAITRAEQAAAQADTDLAQVVDQLTLDRARRGELGDMLADGELGRDEYRRLLARIDGRIGEAERRLAHALPAPVALPAGVGDLRADWDAMTLEERRDVVTAVAECFEVLPATVYGGRWDPARVRPVWRFEEDARK